MPLKLIDPDEPQEEGLKLKEPEGAGALKLQDPKPAGSLKLQDPGSPEAEFHVAEDVPAKGPDALFEVPDPGIMGVLGRIPEAISPLSLPAHEIQATAMDRPDLQKSALKMDVEWWTPEASELRHEWPSPTEIRRRMQAVAAVQSKWRVEDPSMLEDREIKEILYDLEMQKIVNDENQTLLKFTIPSYEIDTKTLGGVPLFIPSRVRGKTISESEQEYLEAGGDPAVVERVRGLWQEQGIDPETDDVIDVEIKAGIPMFGADVLTQIVTDPLFFLGGVGKPRGVRALTPADEYKRVGMVPSLGKQTTKLEKIRAEQEALTVKAATQREAAQVGKARSQEQLARGLHELDPEIGKRADDLLNVENDVLRVTREAVNPHVIDDVMEDDILAIGYGARGTGSQAKQMRKLVADKFPSIGKAAIDEKVNELMHVTKPLRAWRRVVRADEALKAADSMDARVGALQDLYLDTGQQIKATRLAMVDELGKIAGGEYGQAGTEFKKAAKNLFLYPTDVNYVQELAEGFGKMTRAQRKSFKHLTGFKWRPNGQAPVRARLGLWGFISRPLDAFEGTGVWESMHRGWRAQRAAEGTAVERVQKEFGHLIQAPREYRNKLVMALDGTKVEALPDGSGRFVYAVADRKTGEVLKRTPINLNADEMVDYTRLRQFFDDYAAEATAAGLKGFEKGKPIIGGYFPRIYDFKRAEGALRYDIPVELQDMVSSGIQFRHLHSRKWVDALVREDQLPDLLEVLPQYSRGMIRKLHMEPALKEADEAAQFLDDRSRTIWKWWKGALKGKPQGADKLLQGIELQFKGHKFNPATQLAFLTSRMMYLGILGGHIGSAIANFTQKVNTAARTGPFHLLRGWTHYGTPKGAAVAKAMNLTDDFVNFFERPAPMLTKLAQATGGRVKTWDELIMSPMHYAEHHNRGVAFWAGASHEAKKHKIYDLKNWSKASKAAQEEIIQAGLRTAEETQFIYGTMGTPPGITAMFGRKIGASVRTLTTFPPNQFAFLVRTAKEDPMGLMRFFLMSGFLSRFGKDAMGVSAENIFGFGFVPPVREDQPLPFAPPTIQLVANWMAVGMADDPFERRHAQERFFQDIGNLVPVPFLGAPKELTGLRQDVGSRTYRTFMRIMRLAEEGVDRGYDESFRRKVPASELAIRVGGLQPESQRQFFQFQKDLMRTVKAGAFDRDSLLDQMAIAFTKGDDDKLSSLLQTGIQSGLLIEGEISDPGFLKQLLQRKIVEQEVPFATRAALRRPELLTSPGLGGRLEKYMEE